VGERRVRLEVLFSWVEALTSLLLVISLISCFYIFGVRLELTIRNAVAVICFVLPILVILKIHRDSAVKMSIYTILNIIESNNNIEEEKVPEDKHYAGGSD
jgi:hypothetical protein